MPQVQPPDTERNTSRRGWPARSAVLRAVLPMMLALSPAAMAAAPAGAPPAGTRPAGAPPAAAAAAADADADARRTVLVMGDSLSAGYGLAAHEGWVSLIGERMARDYPGCRIANASISGETSAGGSSRVVGEVLHHRPAVVVIALGANDALRGLPLRELHRNLARMVGASQYVGAEVLLVGMRMPPNLGADYTRGFERTYRQLADFFDVPLLPFLLEPVATDRAFFQDDNLHPTADAQPRIAAHVWPALAPLLNTACPPARD